MTDHAPVGDLATRADIARFVRAFYRQAATDDVLGPVFAAARVDWSAHVATLIEFWSWQLLGDGDYDGNPLLAHRPVHARTPLGAAHYARWLQVLDDTLDDGFAGPRTEMARERGRKMAAALQRLMEPSDRHLTIGMAGLYDPAV